MERPYQSPSRTIITSFTPRRPRAVTGTDESTTLYEEGDWVLCLATPTATLSSSPPESFACALSNGEVQVYDTQKLHVQRSFPPSAYQQQQQQHQFAASPLSSSSCITDLQYGPQHSLLTCKNDGSVQLLDLRQAQVAQYASLPSSALCLSLGYEGSYVAAVGSTKGRIHFVDLRQMGSGVLGTYTDCHQDDVTVVEFAPETPQSWLLTGAEDGLLCLLDTTQPTEELALQSVLNVGAPVRKAGFCGQNGSVLYCLTGNETLSLWKNQGPATTLLQNNTRQQLLAATQSHHSHRGSQQPMHMTSNTYSSSHPHRSTTDLPDFAWSSIDYLVDAHWDPVQQQLVVMAGGSTTQSSLGCSALFGMEASPMAVCQPHYPQGGTAGPSTRQLGDHSFCFQHLKSFVGGHAGVVRAWCSLGNGMIVTAGEDARLCEWQLATPHGAAAIPSSSSVVGIKRPPAGSPNRDNASNGGGPLRRQRHKASNSPY